jgi:hypothetical protein
VRPLLQGRDAGTSPERSKLPKDEITVTTADDSSVLPSSNDTTSARKALQAKEISENAGEDERGLLDREDSVSSSSNDTTSHPKHSKHKESPKTRGRMKPLGDYSMANIRPLAFRCGADEGYPA